MTTITDEARTSTGCRMLVLVRPETLTVVLAFDRENGADWVGWLLEDLGIQVECQQGGAWVCTFEELQPDFGAQGIRLSEVPELRRRPSLMELVLLSTGESPFQHQKAGAQ